MDEWDGGRGKPQGVTEAPPVRPRTVAWLHWATLALLVIGLSMILAREWIEARGPRQWLLEGHRWCGLLVLGLCAARLILRWRVGRLPWLVPAAPWVRILAAGMHGSLYALLAAVPVLGWTFSSAAGQHVQLFGLALARLVEADEDLAETLGRWHTALAFTLISLIVAHAGVALWHHFVLRDSVLRAMWPWPSRRPPRL